MDADGAQQAIGVGPMATLLEHRDIAGRLGVRDRIEPSRRVPLLWGGHGTRSLLVSAFTAGALLVAFGITLLLQSPPALEALLPLRALGIMLMALGIVVAPVDLAARAAAAWMLVLHALVVVAGVLAASTHLFGHVRYGAISANDYLALATWLTVLLLLRRRHPLTILVTCAAVGVVSLAVFGRVLPWVRDDGVHAMSAGGVVTDVAVANACVVGIGLGGVLLAWWLDSWIRTFLPLRPPLASRPTRSERPRLRRSTVLVACMLDPVAIVLLHLAKHAGATMLRPDEDWFATAMLYVAYAKLTIAGVVVTALVITALDPAWT